MIQNLLEKIDHAHQVMDELGNVLEELTPLVNDFNEATALVHDFQRSFGRADQTALLAGQTHRRSNPAVPANSEAARSSPWPIFSAVYRTAQMLQMAEDRQRLSEKKPGAEYSPVSGSIPARLSNWVPNAPRGIADLENDVGVQPSIRGQSRLADSNTSFLLATGIRTPQTPG